MDPAATTNPRNASSEVTAAPTGETFEVPSLDEVTRGIQMAVGGATLKAKTADGLRYIQELMVNVRKANRRKNTKDCYSKCWRLWDEWCQENGFEDKTLVFEKKALIFLCTVVLNMEVVSHPRLISGESSKRKNERKQRARAAAKKRKTNATESKEVEDGSDDGDGDEVCLAPCT